MATIIPAIIPVSRADLEAKLERLHGLCEEVQIDLVDGAYAAPASWPCIEGDHVLRGMHAAGDLIPAMAGMRVEADLMIADPQVAAGAWIDLGASRIVLHLESVPDPGSLLDSLEHEYGHDAGSSSSLFAVGLAVGAATDPALAEPYLDRVDFVQFMGVERIGSQGQPFSERVLPRIAAFRSAHPDLPVQVDGGVSLETAPALLDAGVSRLVVGSAIMGAPNVREALESFQRLAEEYGRYQ